MMKELVLKTRSYRRFDETEKMDREQLLELVDLARMTASTSNSQALRFYISCDEQTNAKIFSTLHWAGVLPEWDGPTEGERPTGYIVILCDLERGKNKMWDDGITAQTMMLGAVEKGYGGCMFGSVDRSKLLDLLGLSPEKYSVDLVLALGKPMEEVRIVPVPENGDVRYYRDENQVHYVPKRELEDIVLP